MISPWLSSTTLLSGTQNPAVLSTLSVTLQWRVQSWNVTGLTVQYECTVKPINCTLLQIPAGDELHKLLNCQSDKSRGIFTDGKVSRETWRILGKFLCVGCDQVITSSADATSPHGPLLALNLPTYHRLYLELEILISVSYAINDNAKNTKVRILPPWGLVWNPVTLFE